MEGGSEHYLRFLAFTLETACRAMDRGQDKWVWIMDMVRLPGTTGTCSSGSSDEALWLWRHAAMKCYSANKGLS